MACKMENKKHRRRRVGARINVYIRGEYGRGKKGNGNGMFCFFFFCFLMCRESAWENLQRNRKVQKRLFRG